LLSLGGSVPAEVQDLANQAFAKNPKPFYLFLAIMCSLGLLKITVEVGLFFFKRWARPVFAILAVSRILAPLAASLLPPEVAAMKDPPLEQTLGILLTMMDGAIIALAYGSAVATLFSGGTPLSGPGAENAG
jgi:hypothetical protein